MITDDTPSMPLASARRVLIVHGFGATPDDHWFPWLDAALPRAERIPLPSPQTPEAEVWVPLVADRLARLGDGTAVVAHSLGNATTLQALRRLASESRPVDLAAFVAVAPFVSHLPRTGHSELDAFLTGDRDQPSSLPGFIDGIDLPALRKHLGAVRVLRSDHDPLVPAASSDAVAAALGASVEEVPGAGHFLAADGVLELPQLLADPNGTA